MESLDNEYRITESNGIQMRGLFSRHISRTGQVVATTGHFAITRFVHSQEGNCRGLRILEMQVKDSVRCATGAVMKSSPTSLQVNADAGRKQSCCEMSTPSCLHYLNGSIRIQREGNNTTSNATFKG